MEHSIIPEQYGAKHFSLWVNKIKSKRPNFHSIDMSQVCDPARRAGSTAQLFLRRRAGRARSPRS
eukprot:15383590-Heterocapsa_arctica.AAC.1